MRATSVGSSGRIRTLRGSFVGCLAVVLCLALTAAPASAAERRIDMGESGPCAIKKDGTGLCFDGFVWEAWPQDQVKDPAAQEGLEDISVGGLHRRGGPGEDAGSWDDNLFFYAGACAVRIDGIPVCVNGSNDWAAGPLGQYDPPEGLDDAIDVDAGFDTTCAVREDGTLACWSTTEDDFPYHPPPSEETCPDWPYFCDNEAAARAAAEPETYKAVSVGGSKDGDARCAITTDDTAVCWGDFRAGLPATPPPALGTVKAIDVGARHACAIQTGGAPVCWGDDLYGQSSVPAGIGSVISISADLDLSCAVKVNGKPVCWGNNANGGTANPPEIGELKSITTGATRSDHNGWTRCGIRTDGYAQCWEPDGNTRKYEPEPAGPEPPDGQRGVHYRHLFETTEFEKRPTMFVRAGGQIPPGLTLTRVWGRYEGLDRGAYLQGTPTTPGTYTFTIRSDDGIFRPVDRTFTMVIGDDPPANTSRPMVTGTPKVGQALTGWSGEWTGSPTSYRRQWMRCDETGNACAGIRGATNFQYTLDAADAGSRMRVRIIATNPSGTAKKVSAPTAVVTQG